MKILMEDNRTRLIIYSDKYKSDSRILTFINAYYQS